MARQHCPHCLRPTPTCYCDLIPDIHSQASLTVLQHPNESQHPKGTAALLNRSINNAEILTGERFSFDAVSQASRQPVLLFPPSPEQLSEPQVVFPEQLEAKSTQLLALDGTWRKTRKLLYENPWLQDLPRLQLSNLPDSRYQIRKAETSAQLSTLEACCYALMAIENNQERYRPLLAAFDQYIERLQQFIPQAGQARQNPPKNPQKY